VCCMHMYERVHARLLFQQVPQESAVREQPNKHGLAVVKRVREKLEGWILPDGSSATGAAGRKSLERLRSSGSHGRSSSDDTTLSVKEQVSLLIEYVRTIVRR